ncbi:MAG: carbon storage regulator [Bryobacterales bacterium]
MLVFRRQPGESFLIGDDVEVRILQVGRGYVKIGVIAPREVGIIRSEIAGLNREAAATDWSNPRVAEMLRKFLDSIKSSRR